MDEVGQGRSAGFTIIEVILFLAISSALIVALLGTVGVTISRQRFTDSTFGLQAFIQQQYNQTLNVVNDRTDSACGGTRGASNCVVLGRAIALSVGSSHVDVYNVTGTEPTGTPTVSGAQLLALYNPQIDINSKEGYDVAWDAKVNGITPSGTSQIVLLRSPDSGLVLSFGGGSNITGALSNGNNTYNVCLQSADLLNSVSAISLSPVAGAEGVTTQFDLTGANLGTICG